MEKICRGCKNFAKKNFQKWDPPDIYCAVSISHSSRKIHLLKVPHLSNFSVLGHFLMIFKDFSRFFIDLSIKTHSKPLEIRGSHYRMPLCLRIHPGTSCGLDLRIQCLHYQEVLSMQFLEVFSKNSYDHVMIID